MTWEIAETKTALIQNLLDSMVITTTNEVEQVFYGYWYEDDYDEDYEEEAREEKVLLDRANNLINNNLTNLRLYRLSAGEIDMYFAGETKNNDWIIVKTTAAET